MGFIIRVLVLLIPFIKEIIKQSPDSKKERVSKYDRAMLLLILAMFAMVMFLGERVYQLSDYSEQLAASNKTLKVANANILTANEQLKELVSSRLSEKVMLEQVLEGMRVEETKFISQIKELHTELEMCELRLAEIPKPQPKPVPKPKPVPAPQPEPVPYPSLRERLETMSEKERTQ